MRILKDMGVSHFDRLTYQVQEEVGGKLTKLTGKLQDYESRKKVGWKDSKELCSILSNIRKQIAEANGIEYVQTECTHTGSCCGTCPACEQELQDLERKLEEKKGRGEHVIIDCVSLFNEELLSFGYEI